MSLQPQNWKCDRCGEFILGGTFHVCPNWEVTSIMFDDAPEHNLVISSTVGKRYNWKPKEDITAYELALCAPAFSMPEAIEFFVRDLPECARRHFEEVV